LGVILRRCCQAERELIVGWSLRDKKVAILVLVEPRAFEINSELPVSCKSASALIVSCANDN